MYRTLTIWCLGLSMANAFASADMKHEAVMENDSPTTMTRGQVVALLPSGYRLAEDIPSSYGLRVDAIAYQQSYYLADVDLDGLNELIVAYYTEPHEFIEDGKENEAFLMRAHVGIFHWNGSAYMPQWDSNGWGYQFRAGLNPDWASSAKNSFTRAYFGVRDINMDGIPDIFFTRVGTGAMGAIFEVWSWNRDRKQYQRVGEAGRARFVDIEGDGIQEIVCDYIPAKFSEEPYILSWDKNALRYMKNDALTAAHKSLLH